MSALSFEGLTPACIEAIARLFETPPTVEPYSPDGSPVYAFDLAGAADGIRIIAWPSLHRVDVRRAGDHSWVLKNVGGVDVIEGVEVVFRPAEGRGFLFVSVNGFVNMVMG